MDGLSPGLVPTSQWLSHVVAALQDRHYRFTAVTPATHRSVNARPENRWAATLQDVFGWSRPFTAATLDPEIFALASAAGILAPHPGGPQPAYRARLRAATIDDLIFLHSAFPTDAADAIFFGPDTYRFAAAVTRHLQSRRDPIPHAPIARAIDVGCGSGAAGIVIARACPGAEVLLADISPAAITLARCNAQAAGATHARFVGGDLFDQAPGQFDLIVANPPYLNDPAGRLYRHGGGPLGAALSLRILTDSLRRLTPGGTLLLYTGSAITAGADLFLQAATAILANTQGLDWHYAELDPDVFGEELATPAYAGTDRIAAVLLTVTRTA